MKFSQDTLMAYADGELDRETRRAIEAEMAIDPQVAREVERQRALRADVGAAFAGVLDEQVPDRLLRATTKSKPAAQRRQWAWPEWTSIAASLVIGVLAGRAMLQSPGAKQDLIATGSGGQHHRQRPARAGVIRAAQLAGRFRRPHRPDVPQQFRRVLPDVRYAGWNECRRLRLPRRGGLAHRDAVDFTAHGTRRRL